MIRLLLLPLISAVVVASPGLVGSPTALEVTRISPAAAPTTPVVLILDATPTPTPTATPTPEPTPTPAARAQPVPTATPHTHAQTTNTHTPTHSHPPTPSPTSSPTPQPTVTAPPTPDPTPRPDEPDEGYDADDVRRRIRKAWPGDDDEAIDVVGCETGWTFDPRMTSADGTYLGLWQFRIETWRTYGGSGDPRDHPPEEQTRVAWNLFEARGWQPWSGCR